MNRKVQSDLEVRICSTWLVDYIMIFLYQEGTKIQGSIYV